MKSFISLIIILYFSRYSDCRDYRFDYKFYKESDGFLKYNPVPDTWLNANLRCQYEGAELASPISYAMLKDMKKMLIENEATLLPMWSGVSAQYSKGDYFSIGGIPLSKMPVSWVRKEPDDFRNSEDCLIMMSNGTLADTPCKDSLPYSCFRKKTALLSSTCGTVDQEYKLDPRTGSCYKFHRSGLVWSRAFMTCAAEGGHLAVIDTIGEDTVLHDIFSRYPSSSLNNRYDSDRAQVGYYDLDGKGAWTTIHGDRFEDMIAASKGYWYSSQPDNNTRNGIGQRCGTVTRTGGIDDYWCDVPNAFICEKRPDSLIDFD